MARILISATHKSSGKTVISIGIAALLQQKGLDVQCFKKGPDFIDPLWLSEASKRPCFNLDFNTQTPSEINFFIASHTSREAIGLIEGTMGLFDSVDPQGSQSNASLARLTETPVLLILDAEGATRSLIPIVQGFRDFEKDLNIAGVILNKVGGDRHAARLREVFNHYSPLPLLGIIPRDDRLVIDERHLGLMPSNEASQCKAIIKQISTTLAQYIDLDQIITIANSAPPLPFSPVQPYAPATPPLPRLRIGMSRDSAFSFYYPDDIAAFTAAGAELVPINTLLDKHLPGDLDGLWLGGGFPETHLAALAANRTLLDDLNRVINAGLPTYAECGGMMLLCRTISWQGDTQPMAGIIAADVVVKSKPQGRGYMRIKSLNLAPWPLSDDEKPFDVHEFHYSILENIDSDYTYGFQVLRGSGMVNGLDGLTIHNLVATWAHQRQVANNHWVDRFVSFIRSRAAGNPLTTE
jgi:cobyrinic acid a,c-diamide synthase